MSQSELIEPAVVQAPTEQRTTPRAARIGWSLLGSELDLLFRRTRNRVLLLVMALVPVLIAGAVRIFSTSDSGGGPPFLTDITRNGLFVAFTALAVTLPLFLPLAVGVVAGDSIAGESGQGTLRYLLVVPVGRTRLLVVKFVAVVAFCLAVALVIAAVGMAIGSLLFPVGPVTLLSGDTLSIGGSLLRVLMVCGYVAASLIGLAAIGLFISTLTDVPVAAMATTVVLSVVSQILDAIPQLHAIAPWLLSHYWFSFGDLLRNPIYTHDIGRGLLLQLGYLVVFGAAAWARFTTRDVSS